jgi:hypothetical protein
MQVDSRFRGNEMTFDERSAESRSDSFHHKPKRDSSPSADGSE